MPGAGLLGSLLGDARALIEAWYIYAHGRISCISMIKLESACRILEDLVGFQCANSDLFLLSNSAVYIFQIFRTFEDSAHFKDEKLTPDICNTRRSFRSLDNALFPIQVSEPRDKT